MFWIVTAFSLVVIQNPCLAQNAPLQTKGKVASRILEAKFRWEDHEQNPHGLNDDINKLSKYGSLQALLESHAKSPAKGLSVVYNDDVQPIVKMSSESRIEYKSSEQGMVGVYNMVLIFLNDIAVPNTIADLIKEYNVEKLSELGNIEIMAWINMYLGLVILAGIGILFVLFFPLFSCFCCCCSCCVSCFKKICCCCCNIICKGPSKITVIFWTVSSAVIVAVLFASVICNFVAVSLMKEQIDGGLTNGMIEGLDNIETFVHGSVGDLKHVTLTETSSMKHQVFGSMDAFPDDALKQLDNTIQADKPLTDLNTFATNMDDLESAFLSMDARAYETQRVGVDPQLDSIATDIKVILNTCFSPNCNQAKTDADYLKSDANYNGLSGLTIAAANAVNQAIVNGVDVNIHTFYDAYKGIPDTINSTMDAELAEVKNAINEGEAKLEDQLETIEDNVGEINFDDVIENIKNIQNDYMPYAHYAITTPSYTIASITLIIVCLYTFGIIFGTFICSTWRLPGISITIANILQFLLLWLFMLIVVVFFVVGGGVETVACRHLVSYDETMDSLAELVKNENQIAYNGSIKHVMDSCYNNDTVYKAMDLENNGFNITEIADLGQYGIYDKIEDIKDMNIDISDVEIIDQTVSDEIDALDQALRVVDMAAYSIQNSKPILQIPLEEYINLLTEVEKEESSIRSEIGKLEDIFENEYAVMETAKRSIETGTNGAMAILDAVNLPEIVSNLNKSQEAINNDANKALSDELVNFASDLVTTVDDYASTIAKGVEDDIGKCFHLFAAIRSFLHTPCVHTLYPLNSIWFCLGWYIAFSIPAIVLTKILQGVFEDKRKVGHSDGKVV